MGTKKRSDMQMTDYSWLHTEMERVKWKSFFVTRKNVSMNSISGASFSPELLPKDYLDFLFEFGEVSFFRNFSSHGHLLSVIAPKIVDVRGRALIYIGGYWLEGRTYLDSEKSRPLILRAGKLRDVADSFSGWLKARFARCKREYSKADWMQLANVPIPFSQQELQVATSNPNRST